MKKGLVLPKNPDLEFVRNVVRERSCEEDATLIEKVIWGSRFRCHNRIAQNYYVPMPNGERGGTFLIGDAAHCHSPSGGQGLSLGIRDGLLVADAIQKDIAGEQGACEAWQKDRQTAAKRTILITGAYQRIWTLTGVPATIRNALLRISGLFAFPRWLVAKSMSGLWTT